MFNTSSLYPMVIHSYDADNKPILVTLTCDADRLKHQAKQDDLAEARMAKYQARQAVRNSNMVNFHKFHA